jgi:GTP-binding protein
MPNIVAIVGRPNVGKSTLFNRFTESRHAIVDEQSGVTRDRHYGKVEWTGRTFSIIDTGGYITGSDDVFEDEIGRQVKLAVEEASLILFMVDVTTGLTDMDKEVASLLRKSKKKVFLVANKVDNFKRIHETPEFYGLGMGDIFSLSAINGSGTGELLDAIVAELKSDEEEESPLPKLAIVGQPNVGKSSLLNALTGTYRTIVTPMAGTTRDTIHTRYQSFGFDFLLVDTAGMRKKTKVKEDLEFYSVMRSVKAIEESDVCLLLIDATQGITGQDINIFSLAERNKKGIVILVNKWDLVEKDTKTTKRFTEDIHKKIAPFTDVPVVFTSVTEKQRIHKALELALQVYENRKRHIATSQLNKIMLPVIDAVQPPAVKGKLIKIKYITQLPGRTPNFAFFANHPQYIGETYRRFIENQMRAHFELSGVPISIFFRSKDKGDSES